MRGRDTLKTLFFFGLVMGGCTLFAGGDAEDVTAQWTGKTKDDLIAAYGSPTSEQPSEQGTTILTWKRAQRHPGGLGRMHEAEAYYTVCIREFEIDHAGIVRVGHQRGCGT